MKKNELEQLLNNIFDSISYYKYENINERSYYLILANGERITVEFPEYAVSHLLGVDTNYAQSTGLFKEKKSMPLLKEICENEFRVYNNMRDGIISEKNLFSDYVERKIVSFRENLKDDVYSNEFVVKYDKSKAYLLGNQAISFDYLLCRKNFEGGYFVLGLIKNDNNIYVPRTNQYFVSKEELYEKYSKLLTNQSFTFISSVKARNFNTFNLNASAKYQKTSILEEYSSKFGGSVDVTGEYKFCLNKYRDNLSTGIILTREYENIITCCMENGDIIEPELFGLKCFETMNGSLVNIIMSYNNMITSSNIKKSNSANTKYSDAIEELKKLKEKCKKLEIKNESDLLKIESLEKDNELLNDSNKQYSKCISEVEKIIKKIKK